MQKRARLIAVKPRTNPDVVTTLRRLCAEAEAGEIRSAAFILVKRGGNISTGWDIECGDAHKAIAGASMLSHRLVVAALED